MRDTVELELSSMAHGGEALGRYAGKVVLVGGCIPGERVIAEIVEDHQRWMRGRLVEVLDPSPYRVQPACPHFGTCGGCQWQHIAYEAQVLFKQSILRDQLRRLGRVTEPPVSETIASPTPWQYRNHLQFSVSPQGKPGFLDASGARVMPVEICLLPHPLVWEMWEMMDLEDAELFLRRLSLRAGIHTGEQMIVFETVDDIAPAIEMDVPISCVLLIEDGTPVNLIGRNWLSEEIGRRRFRISAGSFFQVNTLQAGRLLEIVEQLLDPRGRETLLDLYCGVGTFALTMAARVERVVGIESYAPAVADARANVLAGEQAEFIEGRAEDVLSELDMLPEAVIVDPPRTGCSSTLLRELIRLSPPRLIYVSCDPATLARDVRQLGAAGYRLERVQPVDMFPQTYHIESVSLLLR